MKFMAVICEYNPFHNGHAYQLREQKEALHCDGVICLMSGSFVQRGEPAISDKWARSEMALASGCDLVLELPVVYSLQSAEGFARGAVALLSKLGVEGYLSFGSECGDISLLERAARVNDDAVFQAALKAHLDAGMAYPKAYGLAVEQVCGTPLFANDMLGVEYLRAISEFAPGLKPSVLKRDRGHHNITEPDDDFLSATGIRERLLSGEEVSRFMPQCAYEILEREIAAGRAPVTTDDLGPLLCYRLRTVGREALTTIGGVSEGLENRLIAAAEEFGSFEQLAERVKTKRYPHTRICRTMIKTLLGITKEDEALLPAYARILGVGRQGGAIIKELQKKATIPFVNKVSDAAFCDETAKRLFALDLMATDLYALLYPKKNTGKSGMDFCRSPVIMLND